LAKYISSSIDLLHIRLHGETALQMDKLAVFVICKRSLGLAFEIQGHSLRDNLIVH